MRLLSTARQHTEINAAKRVRFTSPWGILAFCAAVIFVFILLYPQEALQRDITGQQNISMVTASYLRNLIRIYPNNERLLLMLAEQEVGLGELDDAEKTIHQLDKNKTPQMQQEISWLNYLMLKQRTYSEPENSILRKEGITAIREQVKILVETINDPDKIQVLAEDALSVDEPYIAYNLYVKLAQDPNAKPGMWLITAGKTALSVSQYKDSANFYLKAMQISSSINQRRTLFIAAVNSLLAGDLPQEALQTANKYYETAFTDKNMLIYMSRVAMSAGHPEQAQVYLKQLLWDKSLYETSPTNPEKS